MPNIERVTWNGLLNGQRALRADLRLTATLKPSTEGGSGAFLGLADDKQHYWIKTLNNAQGKAMYQMLGVFSEFERAMIRDRVIAGLERARAQGTRLGRPRVGWMIETQIRKLRAIGFGIHRTAKKAGCGVSVVQRVVAAE